MFPGQWIHSPSGSVTLWSPWFPRGADNAIFTYELMVAIGSPTFTVDVYHKNTEDTGNGSIASGSFSLVGATTFYTSTTYANLKELVRFKFTVTAEASVASVLFRMLTPTWIVQAA